MRKNDIIDRYVIKALTTAPLHVGSASGAREEVLIHPVTELPFLQASGIAGALRAASLKVCGQELTESLFGSSLSSGASEDAGSRVNVSDGLFEKDTVHLEYRPRVAVDPVTGTVSGGHKFSMEMVAAGAVFTFSLYLQHGADDQDDQALEKILAQLAAGRLQFGGQKSNGAGMMELTHVMHCRYDLRNKEDRRAWALADDAADSEDITEKILAAVHAGSSIQAFEILVTGETEGALLIKSAAVSGFGAGAADAEQMTDAADHYLIPGSSLKGALRNRVSDIAFRLGKAALADACFGKAAKGEDPGIRGNIRVHDAIIGSDEKKAKAMLQHRIHIDKFTGGVMQTGLFAEQTVSGAMTLQVDVMDRGDPKAAAGLVTLAIRDLSQGQWNLGSGYGIGRGFVEASRMTIRSLIDGRQAEIDFARGTINDQDQLIGECLKAVSDWKEVKA